MRHQLCDSTVAVCVSAAAWLLNDTSVLLFMSHRPDFSPLRYFYVLVRVHIRAGRLMDVSVHFIPLSSSSKEVFHWGQW